MQETVANRDGGSYAYAHKWHLTNAHNQIGCGCILPVLRFRGHLRPRSAFAEPASRFVANERVCLHPSFNGSGYVYRLRAGGLDCVARASLSESYKDWLADCRKSDEPSVGIRDSGNGLFLGRQIELLAVE